jgi:hypothetical protein
MNGTQKNTMNARRVTVNDLNYDGSCLRCHLISQPVYKFQDFRLLDFCWTECTSLQVVTPQNTPIKFQSKLIFISLCYSFNTAYSIQ